MSYSDVAATIGSRAARAVGRVMSHYGSELPWWRVVRASGEPPIDHSARALDEYRREGTALVHTRAGGYRVDMTIARHSPNAQP
jgi:alkylated DNA nucleotide flippase Atl1